MDSDTEKSSRNICTRKRTRSISNYQNYYCELQDREITTDVQIERLREDFQEIRGTPGDKKEIIKDAENKEVHIPFEIPTILEIVAAIKSPKNNPRVHTLLPTF